MKKVIALASVLALSACAVVGLAACEEEAAHTHTYGSWTVEKAATLFEDGLQSASARRTTATPTIRAGRNRQFPRSARRAPSRTRSPCTTAG